MSFSMEFTAVQADAVRIVAQHYAPECVKEFIRKGLVAFAPDALVYVKAHGHLYNNDYQRSNADIVVQQVLLTQPKPEPKPEVPVAPLAPLEVTAGPAA